MDWTQRIILCRDEHIPARHLKYRKNQSCLGSEFAGKEFAMLFSKRWLLCLVALFTASDSLQAQVGNSWRVAPLNYFARFHGFGYSDGYHSCITEACKPSIGSSLGEGFSTYYSRPSTPVSDRNDLPRPSYITHQMRQSAHVAFSKSSVYAPSQVVPKQIESMSEYDGRISPRQPARGIPSIEPLEELQLPQPMAPTPTLRDLKPNDLSDPKRAPNSQRDIRVQPIKHEMKTMIPDGRSMNKFSGAGFLEDR